MVSSALDCVTTLTSKRAQLRTWHCVCTGVVLCLCVYVCMSVCMVCLYVCGTVCLSDCAAVLQNRFVTHTQHTQVAQNKERPNNICACVCVCMCMYACVFMYVCVCVCVCVFVFYTLPFTVALTVLMRILLCL